MNNLDKTSRSGATTDIAVSSLDVHQRLRLAARILQQFATSSMLEAVETGRKLGIIHVS